MIGTISSSTAANGILAIATKQSDPKTGSVFSPSSLSVENTTQSSVRSLGRSAVASSGESQNTSDRPGSGVSGRDLSSKEKAVVRELEMRDREVHAHEQAHATAGAGIAGAPSYSYETGPDGRRYAVGGEVPIHVRTGSDDPQVAIQQYAQVVRAALAPANPSSQDRAVAANAQTKIAELQGKAASERQSKAPGSLANESGAAKNETETTSADLFKTAAVSSSSFAAYRSSLTQQLSSPDVLRGRLVSRVA
jgi:SprA-related family